MTRHIVGRHVNRNGTRQWRVVLVYRDGREEVWGRGCYADMHRACRYLPRTYRNDCTYRLERVP